MLIGRFFGAENYMHLIIVSLVVIAALFLLWKLFAPYNPVTFRKVALDQSIKEVNAVTMLPSAVSLRSRPIARRIIDVGW